MVNPVESGSVFGVSSLETVGLDSLVLDMPVQEAPKSTYRHVFTNQRQEFAQFLNTIFFQLDEKKVFEMMDDILADPNKTDDEVYSEITSRIGETKKRLLGFIPIAPVLQAFKALPTVRTGMAKQVKKHMEGFEGSKFDSYLEISTRRYGNAIQKEGGFKFKKMTAASDEVGVSILKRFEVGALFSKYPFQESVLLNDDDCDDYTVETEKTYKPLDPKIESSSVDMLAVLGGLHHIPEDRIEPFVQSMERVLKPGGVLLLRDHDASNPDVKALAAVVHSFVNAEEGLSLEAEKAEISNFQAESHFVAIMERNGFTRVDKQHLILPKDPTQNAMTAFVKTPTTADEVEEAAKFIKGYQRAKNGSAMTWLEWGNVWFEKQYADFIQDHHSYAFDYIGHIRQHWSHFYHTVKESMNDPKVSTKEILLSDNTLMNLFILFGTTGQLGISALTSFPSACVARWKHGEGWRDVTNLSALEKFDAEFKKDYSTFIDYDPFFKYPYFSTIGKMWQTVYNSKDSFFTKVGDVGGALVSTVTLGIQGIASAFINNIYYSSDETSDLEVEYALINASEEDFDRVVELWNAQKMETEFNGKHPFEKCELEKIYSAEGRMLVKIPFYNPFMDITKLFAENRISFVKIGGQKEITMDLLLRPEDETPVFEGARVVYGLPQLQDPEGKRRVTYEVKADKLTDFCTHVGKDHVVHIHAHR